MMSDWFETCKGIDARVWDTIAHGVADRNHVARTPTFATVRDGLPEACTVVIRAVDPIMRTVDIHTDLGTAKVQSLRETPHAALHIWDPEQRLQIRLQTSVTLLNGAAVADIWANVPDLARNVYGTTPKPGTPITGALDYETPADADAFVVMRCRVTSCDALYLGKTYRRAVFKRERNWLGTWVAP